MSNTTPLEVTTSITLGKYLGAMQTERAVFATLLRAKLFVTDEEMLAEIDEAIAKVDAVVREHSEAYDDLRTMRVGA